MASIGCGQKRRRQTGIVAVCSALEFRRLSIVHPAESRRQRRPHCGATWPVFRPELQLTEWSSFSKRRAAWTSSTPFGFSRDFEGLNRPAPGAFVRAAGSSRSCCEAADRPRPVTPNRVGTHVWRDCDTRKTNRLRTRNSRGRPPVRHYGHLNLRAQGDAGRHSLKGLSQND